MASLWISRVDLEQLIGREAALALLTAFPGRRIYIPMKATAEKFTAIVGSKANEILCNEFRGFDIMLPSSAIQPVTKKERIIPLLKAGRTYAEVAAEIGCTERHVAYVAVDSGLTPAERSRDARREAGPKA